MSDLAAHKASVDIINMTTTNNNTTPIKGLFEDLAMSAQQLEAIVPGY